MNLKKVQIELDVSDVQQVLAIALDEDNSSIETKVLSMFTDPQRLRKTDTGHPQRCNVFSYYQAFKPELKDEVYNWCTQAQKGCKECKTILAQAIIKLVSQKRDKKKTILKDKDFVYNILLEGKSKAAACAQKMLAEVKEAMGI